MSYRIRPTSTPGYWTVEEFVANQFCGAWHALFTGSHETCATFVRTGRMP